MSATLLATNHPHIADLNPHIGRSRAYSRGAQRRRKSYSSLSLRRAKS